MPDPHSCIHQQAAPHTLISGLVQAPWLHYGPIPNTYRVLQADLELTEEQVARILKAREKLLHELAAAEQLRIVAYSHMDTAAGVESTVVGLSEPENERCFCAAKLQCSEDM